MDELLALMEEAEANPSPPAVSSSSPCQDESPTTEDATKTNNNKRKQQHKGDNKNKKRQQPKKEEKSASQKADEMMDRQLQMRLTDRKISSLDLMELVQASNYRSPILLAKMGPNSTVLQRQQILQIADPSSSSNSGVGGGGGNTNLLTIGLVINNSGTKIATNGGKAFCVLQVGGNIQSSAQQPPISVLLFGDAYSKYCQSIKPGTVIGLENPRLIPTKSSTTTTTTTTAAASISFSIHDVERLFVIGKARDYGVCQAPVRGKNAQGFWVNNARRCLAPIDIRSGTKYCHLHRHLDPNNSAKTVQKGTFIQQQQKQKQPKETFMKQQRRQQQLKQKALQLKPLRGKDGKGPLILPNNKAPIQVSGRLGGGVGAARRVPMQMSRLTVVQQNNLNNNNNNNNKKNNSILNAAYQQQRQQQPMTTKNKRPQQPLANGFDLRHVPSKNPKLATNRLLNPNTNLAGTTPISNHHTGVLSATAAPLLGTAAMTTTAKRRMVQQSNKPQQQRKKRNTSNTNNHLHIVRRGGGGSGSSFF